MTCATLVNPRAAEKSNAACHLEDQTKIKLFERAKGRL